MDNVLRYAKLMFLCLGILTLTSCEPDDEATFDDLVRYGWAGDLGFSDNMENRYRADWFWTEMVLVLMTNVILTI